MNIIIYFNNLELKRIKIDEPKSNYDDNYQIPLTYQISNHLFLENIMIDTCFLYVPNALKKYKNINDLNTNLIYSNKYFLDLVFDNIEDIKENYLFYKKINEIDNFFESKKEYIRKLLKLDCNLTYVRQIKKNKYNHYLPSFKAKIQKNQYNLFDVDILDKDNNKINEKLEDYVLENCYIKLVIYFDTIWIVKDKMGISWKIKKITKQNR